MSDVVPSNLDLYKGQAKDNTYWSDRDQATILESYSPGYAGQIKYVSNTKPNAVLLSIGGNDIAFADIVKRVGNSAEVAQKVASGFGTHRTTKARKMDFALLSLRLGGLVSSAQVGEALFEVTTLFRQGLRFLVVQTSTEVLTELIESR